MYIFIIYISFNSYFDKWNQQLGTRDQNPGVYIILNTMVVVGRDEDPVLAKNRIRGSVPQTKGDFQKVY